MRFLEKNRIYHGSSEDLMQEIEPESVALSFWSPPYFVGKDYEKNENYESWQTTLRTVIKQHFDVLKPVGFMVMDKAASEPMDLFYNWRRDINLCANPF